MIDVKFGWGKELIDEVFYCFVLDEFDSYCLCD